MEKQKLKFNEIEKSIPTKMNEMFECEMCGEFTDTAKRKLDDLIVCEYCYQDAIDSDSWGILPENYGEE